MRFEILDHGSPRPDLERVIFCDGAGGGIFREGADLDLSHWRPNHTAPEYRAGTSTEICFRFLDRPRAGPWTAAVNNHVDVDGILSVHVLAHPEAALSQRQAIIQAAEMGDFWGWGDPPAQRLFQGLSWMMANGGEGRDLYEEAFRRIPGLLAGSDSQTAHLEESLAPLRQGLEWVEKGRISRIERAARFSQYVIPRSIAAEIEGDFASLFTYSPEFNEPITAKAMFWPHARARWDRERMGLVSVEMDGGWIHDLWAPGYLWADTEGLWRPHGFDYGGGMSAYAQTYQPLLDAFASLGRLETEPGSWSLGGTPTPLGSILLEKFPLVGRFSNSDGDPTPSGLSPERVANELAKVYEPHKDASFDG